MAFAKCDYIDKIKIETYWNVNAYMIDHLRHCGTTLK